MTVSKRLRFEVLKRDNHTCRYCGASAPDVKLAVDHVTPVALGGTDLPTNLVTACVDCNSGKTSTASSDYLVADIKEGALRHAELAREAYKVLVEQQGKRNDYIDEWVDAWTAGDDVPSDWRKSIARWFEMGVPIDIPVDAAEIACASSKWFKGTGRFSYMCGIVWRQVQAVTDLASEYEAIEGSFMSEDTLLDIKYENYLLGVESGCKQSERDALRGDPLSWLVDRIEYQAPASWGAA